MPSLPPLDVEGARLRLPLSSDVAAGLFDALLAEDANERVRRLDALIARDAPLALWTVVLSTLDQATGHRTSRSLAGWLEPRLLDSLAGLADARSTRQVTSQQDQAARRAEVAARVAARSAELAREAKLDVHQARLAGLLHQAHEWLSAGGLRQKRARDAALPDWLGSLLAAMHAPRGASDDPMAATVRRATRTSQRGRAAGKKQIAPTWRPASREEARRVGVLAERLQRLARLERRFDELLEAEKLEAMAELAAGAGHEMNPPLAIISGRAQLLIREETDAERRRELALVNRQALRVHEMIADLMHFARPARVQATRCDIAALAAEVLGGLRDWADERRVELACALPAEPVVAMVDAGQLHVALRAVVANAIEAVGSDGRVEVGCRVVEAMSSVEISVRDTGQGINSEVRRHLFDPFYSGRAAGRGLGMGLAKCWRIVTNHGGRIDVESEPAEGTTVRIVLPIVGPAEVADGTPGTQPNATLRAPNVRPSSSRR